MYGNRFSSQQMAELFLLKQMFTYQYMEYIIALTFIQTQILGTQVILIRTE